MPQLPQPIHGVQWRGHQMRFDWNKCTTPQWSARVNTSIYAVFAQGVFLPFIELPQQSSKGQQMPKRGRPAIAEPVLFVLWSRVVDQIASNSAARSINAACKAVLHNGARPLVFFDESGKRVLTVTDWRRLRAYFYQARDASREAAKFPMLSARCKAVQETLEESQHQSRIFNWLFGPSPAHYVPKRKNAKQA